MGLRDWMTIYDCATIWQSNPSNVGIMPGSSTPAQALMLVRRYLEGFSLLLATVAALSCGGSNGPIAPAKPSSEILYFLQNGSITTYSIDPNSLAATPVEDPVTLTSPPASLLQFDPSPKDHFVYDVWADGQNVQHLSVFQTDDFGVPQLPAIQTLDADSLSQFNLHPTGKFAYMLQVTTTNNQYFAKIRLFAVQNSAGKLKENVQLQGTYGPAPFWPALLYGFSPDASKLYISAPSTTSSVYLQRAINTGNGTLGATKQLISLNGTEDVSIGSVIAVLNQSAGASNQGYLDIFPNVPNPKRAVHCTAAMLTFCGSASNVQLGISGKYLFLTDPVSDAVHVVRVNLSKSSLVDTGSSMPISSQTPGFVFNHDGSIVYEMETDGNLHFFHFDSNTGTLTEGGTPLPIAQGSGICPAHHQ